MSGFTPLHALFVPFVGAFFIGATGKEPNLRETCTIITSLVLFGVVVSMVPTAMEGRSATMEVLTVVPGIPLAFHIEPLGMIYALIASGLWILNSIYSIGYMRGNHEKNQTRFYICFSTSIACVMGIAFAANMLTLFIFYEALSLSTYPLVTHSAPKPEAVRSGRVYLGILVGTSITLMLPAMIATYLWAGSLDFVEGGVFRGALASGDISPGMFGLIFAMFAYGIGKAALMPSHRWLPAAMVAPTPVSALLHAVAVVKAGVFTICKVSTYLIGVDQLAQYGVGSWLLYVAGASVVIASFIALFQDHLKRRLAYSTISQLSYITMGAAMFNPVGMMAAAMHIAAHAFGKITLFFAAGAIHTAAHKDYVSQLDGIGRKMPWTMGAFTIATLSMIGLPPTAGFLSKWYLMQGAWRAEEIFVLCVLVISTLLNAGYFLPILYRAFFKPPFEPPPPDPHDGDDEHHDDHHHAPLAEHGEAPLACVLALCTTAGLTIAMFVYPNVFFGLARTLMESMPQ